MLSKIHIITIFLITLSSNLFISPTFSNTTTTTYSSQSKSNAKYTSFIKTACNTTTYPTLCLKTCLPYASTIAGDSHKLAISALTATLIATKSSASAVTKLSLLKNLGMYDANVVRDCFENIGDSVDDLKQSIEEMKDLEGSNNYNSNDVKFKVSNIQTWMSAAITNESTCMDGIKEGKVSPFVKDMIRKCILGVAKLTSNALSLCNHLQY
ncbi:21 kDa protein-like [Silene latifolia]|uniref:21 kDa protein-like n=1 Tax=Silene latifolia TaxID=37657 RepID=UPI003D782B77